MVNPRADGGKSSGGQSGSNKPVELQKLDRLHRVNLSPSLPPSLPPSLSLPSLLPLSFPLCDVVWSQSHGIFAKQLLIFQFWPILRSSLDYDYPVETFDSEKCYCRVIIDVCTHLLFICLSRSWRQPRHTVSVVHTISTTS